MIGTLLIATVVAFTQPTRTPPNIVLIMADDLGYGEVGCYGQKKIRTPSIDSLAADGLRFTRFYSGSPVCAPSRCVLLTGLHTGHAQIRGNDEYPKGINVWKNRAIEGQRPLVEGTTTIGTLLSKAGYVTGCFGKWGLGAAGTTGAPERHGFDRFFGYLCQRQAHNFYPTHLWSDGQKVLLDGNLGHGHLTGEHYSHDLIARAALEFIDENHERPFFLYVPFTIPHVALQVPDDSLREYIGAFEETPYDGSKGYLPHETPRAAYAAMVTRMDKDVGRILDRLERYELQDNTVVFFTSDNGPTFNGGSDSAFFESTAGLRGLKASLYEGGIRVPTVARWNGRVAQGDVSDHVAGFQDFMVTIADIAGIDREDLPEHDGVSFLPTLTGGEQIPHDHLYFEHAGAQAVIRGHLKAIRKGARKREDGRIELYDLQTDPFESKNIASECPRQLAEMAGIMNIEHAPTPVEKWRLLPSSHAGSREGVVVIANLAIEMALEIDPSHRASRELREPLRSE